MLVLWFVVPQGGRLHNKENSSDIKGGWSESMPSTFHIRFHGVAKWLSQLQMDGSSIYSKSFGLDTLKCFGISHLSVSNLEVFKESLAGKQLVIVGTLTVNSLDIATHRLIDCKATDITYMTQDLLHIIRYQFVNGRKTDKPRSLMEGL